MSSVYNAGPPLSASPLPQIPLGHLVNAHDNGLPQEFRPHSQVLGLLRTPPNQDRQQALADFIEECNTARKKDKHAPKFSSVKEEDMQKIQSFCATGNTDAIHTLMRKKGWKTLTLILGDDVVTLCRPQKKDGDMQYVRNCVDAGEDRTEINSGNNGKPLKLKDHPKLLELLAGQLMQQQDAKAVTSGLNVNQDNDENAVTQAVQAYMKSWKSDDAEQVQNQKINALSDTLSKIIKDAKQEDLLTIHGEMKNLIGDLEEEREKLFQKLPEDLQKEITNYKTASGNREQATLQVPAKSSDHYDDYNAWENLDGNLIPALERGINDVNNRLPARTA